MTLWDMGCGLWAYSGLHLFYLPSNKCTDRLGRKGEHLCIYPIKPHFVKYLPPQWLYNVPCPKDWFSCFDLDIVHDIVWSSIYQEPSQVLLGNPGFLQPGVKMETGRSLSSEKFQNFIQPWYSDWHSKKAILQQSRKCCLKMFSNRVLHSWNLFESVRRLVSHSSFPLSKR